jgi:hypothetical protein
MRTFILHPARREFRSPEQHRAKFHRIPQSDRVRHAAKRELLISDQQSQTDTGKNIVELSISGAHTVAQVAL